MKVRFSPRLFAMTCGVILVAQGLVAQTCPDPAVAPAVAGATSCVQVFQAVDTRLSAIGTSTSSPNAFNTSNLNLTCTTSPIVAKLTGPLLNPGQTAPVYSTNPQAQPNTLQAGGYLIVDDNLFVTGPGNGSTSTDVCPSEANGGYDSGDPVYGYHCFDPLYETYQQEDPTYAPGSPGLLGGLDPDLTIAPAGLYGSPPAETQIVDFAQGVAPIDISGLLTLSTSPTPAPESVTIAVEDEGGVLVSSSIFLATNCTVGGVSSGTVSGNPISNDIPSSLNQTFTFNSNPGNGTTQNPPQVVSFVYDVSKVTSPGNGSIPQTSDAPLAIGDFPTKYALNTSFATSNCLIHTGEVLTDGVTPACKLYTLECIDPNTGLKAGANCPISSELNEVVADFFDGPQFSLQNVYTPYGVFHEGIGFLMASDDWTPPSGGPCTFDADLANLPCPQNLLINFSGPGIFKSSGITTEPNSTFVSIAGVPEDHTSVVVAGQWPDYWVNNKSPKVSFTSQAPNLSKGASVLNSSNKLVPLTTAGKYIPAPIHSITYGISTPNSVPLPATEPIQTDNTVINPLFTANGCPVPTQGSPGPNVQPNFSTGPQSLSFTDAPLNAPLPDGKYLLHYYAQDCAGTEELQFAVNPDPNNHNVPTWSTSFYTFPINIDTVAPQVKNLTITTPGAPYKIGQTLTATFSCSDANPGAGVVLCGVNVYAPETKYTTTDIGTLKLNFTANSTGKFTVYVADGAGNTNSATVTYTLKH